MDRTAITDFLTENSRAVLATSRRNGGIQMSPVLAVLDGEGYLAISSRETAYKVKNLRRDPRASLCVMNEGFFGKWAFVEGRAQIVSLPEAMDGLVDYYRRGAGEHDDWDEYRSEMERQKRCLIRIPLDRVGPNRFG